MLGQLQQLKNYNNTDQLQQLKNYNNPRATTTGPEYHSCDTTLTTCQPLLPTCHAAAVLTHLDSFIKYSRFITYVNVFSSLDIKN